MASIALQIQGGGSPSPSTTSSIDGTSSNASRTTAASSLNQNGSTSSSSNTTATNIQDSTPSTSTLPALPTSPYDPSHFYTSSGPIKFDPTISPSTSPGVPVFQPTLSIFSNFESYCNAIDSWGMSTGIIKIIPPKGWSSTLPSLNSKEAEESNTSVKQVRIRNAIAQHFTAAGSGVWRQTNITRSRQWNLKQWSDLCQEVDQKGPEMKRIKGKLRNPLPDSNSNKQMDWEGKKKTEVKNGEGSTGEDGVRTRSGRGRAKLPPPPPSKLKRRRDTVEKLGEGEGGQKESATLSEIQQDEEMPVLEEDQQLDRMVDSRPASPSPSNGDSRQGTPSASTPTAIVNKRKHRLTGRALAETTTEQEWETFDHETCWLKEALDHKEGLEPESSTSGGFPTPQDWTPEFCKELEGEYWRGLNFGKPPMYGADLKGTLFTDDTKDWNVGKLDNLLTRLKMRKKLPGVTTPYLYLGMWRATFAWHVEDMDLYSINYIHFGAPKQWYSIRQADKGRFESALRGSFPQDSSRCPHFMRHKSYLVSPSYLSNHGVHPLTLVQHSQEFVITYPFGYHSGYNLGFNCAESVNFALDSWIDIGRKAGFCKCSEESVHMDIDAILEESKQLEEEERLLELEKVVKEKERKKAEAVKKAEKTRLKNQEKARKVHSLNANPNQNSNEMYGYYPGAGIPGAKKIKLTNDNYQEYSSMPIYQQGYGYPSYAYPHTQGSNGYPYPYNYSQQGQSQVLPRAPQQISAPALAPKVVAKPKNEVPQNSCGLCASDVAEDLVKVKSEGANKPALFAHRLCASLIPETWVGRKGDEENENIQNTDEEVKGWDGIAKARWNLKCGLCPTVPLSRQGAKIQCTWGSCTRAAHVSCVLGAEAMLDSSESNKNESDALREESGWFLDVLNEVDADKLEGKGRISKATKGKGKKKAGKQESQAESSQEDSSPQAQVEGTNVDGGDVNERLVILCKSHNPLLKQLEETRKNNAVRTLVMELPIGSVLDVKYSVGYNASVTLIEIKDREGGASGEGEGTIVVRDLAASSDSSTNSTEAPTTTIAWKKINWTEDQEKELVKLKDGGAEESRARARKEAEDRSKKRKMVKTAEEESLEEEKAMKLKGIAMRQEKAERKRMEEMIALNANGGQIYAHQQGAYAPYGLPHAHLQQHPQAQCNPYYQQQMQQRYGYPQSYQGHSAPAYNSASSSRPSEAQYSSYPPPPQGSNGSQMHYQLSHLQPGARPPIAQPSSPITSYSQQHQISKPTNAHPSHSVPPTLKSANGSSPRTSHPYSNPISNPFLPTQPSTNYYAYQVGPQATRDWQRPGSSTNQTQVAPQTQAGHGNQEHSCLGNSNSPTPAKLSSSTTSHQGSQVNPYPHSTLQQQYKQPTGIHKPSDPSLYSSQPQNYAQVGGVFASPVQRSAEGLEMNGMGSSTPHRSTQALTSPVNSSTNAITPGTN